MLSRLALLLLLATPACSQRSSTATAPIDAPAARADAPIAHEPPARNAPFTLTATDGLPADLVDEQPLWEGVRAPHGNDSTTAARLYRDGRFFLYTAFCRTTVDGQPTARPAPLAWRLEARVSEQGLTAIDRSVRDLLARGILASPATARRPDLRPEQTSLTLRTWIDGAEYVIVTDGDGNEVRTPWSDVDYQIHSNFVEGSYPTETC